jgi:hypothetical protein
MAAESICAQSCDRKAPFESPANPPEAALLSPLAAALGMSILNTIVSAIVQTSSSIGF